MALVEHHLAHDGDSHRFLLAAPRGPVEQVLLSLHGTRGTAARQVRTSGLERLADEGVLVCFPEAPSPIERGREWVHETDAPWLGALIEGLVAGHERARGRVVLTGWSGGARMSCRLASEHGELVAALVAVGGIRAPTGDRVTGSFPVLAFHGTADEVNPYDGSGTERWDESVPQAVAAWARARGLQEPAETRELLDGVDCPVTTYGTRGSAEEVRLVTVPGAPHAWPGARALGWRGLLGHRPIPAPSASAAIAELARRVREPRATD